MAQSTDEYCWSKGPYRKLDLRLLTGDVSSLIVDILAAFGSDVQLWFGIPAVDRVVPSVLPMDENLPPRL